MTEFFELDNSTEVYRAQELTPEQVREAEERAAAMQASMDPELLERLEKCRERAYELLEEDN